MNIKASLSDLVLILEGLEAEVHEMSEAQAIDLAARLRPAAKHIEAIDKYVKGNIKEKLNHKDGSRLGNLFKAVLKLVPTERFDTAAFKEERPKMYASYVVTNDVERITFDVR